MDTNPTAATATTTAQGAGGGFTLYDVDTAILYTQLRETLARVAKAAGQAEPDASNTEALRVAIQTLNPGDHPGTVEITLKMYQGGAALLQHADLYVSAIVHASKREQAEAKMRRKGVVGGIVEDELSGYCVRLTGLRRRLHR